MRDSQYMKDARKCLLGVKGHPLTVEERREAAIELTGLMLMEARRTQSRHEQRTQKQLAAMMRDPIGKAFTTSMTDQCFRSTNSYRVANQLSFLIKKFGIPTFLTSFKKAQLKAFQWVGRLLAPLTIPLVKALLRHETAAVILPGEPKQLSKHMTKRRQEGVRINLNHLGEAILGEEEAQRRLNIYLDDLANPEVEYISVKISTICSQINLLSWEDTLSILLPRLKQLYRMAKNHLYIKPDGSSAPKFVNLDMEEYRDLHLTVELFRKALDDAEFFQHSAGIVLQSYLPDAFHIQQELTLWAQKRVTTGGAPIKIRIVKGANLAMEKVEASMRGWPQAPYLYKSEVDANFKRMVLFGCQPEHNHAVHLGIASHNLFDIAYAMLLRAEKNLQHVGMEMLEGMADPIRRVVQKLSGDMLLYCPAATKSEFQNAVAYLVRRLDENTAPENFLRHAFDLKPGTKDWQIQSELFSNACYAASTVSKKPRRQQNRLSEPEFTEYNSRFVNEPDTDWSLDQNRKWAETTLNQWSSKKIDTIPLILGEQTINTTRTAVGQDPSFPNKELYRYALGGEKELELALQTAEIGFKTWSSLPLRERLLLVEQVKNQLCRSRGELIGSMVADTGKTVVEADVEVSEAIDFAAYYRRNVEEYHFLYDIQLSSKGPVLVAPPWNFPCSIPASGILAALCAGNSVIFKPAPESVLVGWTLVNIFWEAGIGKDVLQFFCCSDDPIGSRLVQDPRIKAVVLTGATATAKHLLKIKPGINLLAETGGKNSMIITSMADRDLAIKDLIQSAFGHAGQKCSACSLAILEKEVYNDLHFRNQLRDAAASLKVGSPWDLSTRINPLIRLPGSDLLRGLTTLEAGEEWLLQPKQDHSNTHLWSPGIKLGVKPGSFMHQTELFGPVLSVICAENLDEAISIANGTPYGLTAGIHTLDEREQIYWKDRIIAGNCYINRGITGAIVQRQPFGGCKESSFGPGAKAGGPNYVLQLMHVEQQSLPIQQYPIGSAAAGLDQYIKQRPDHFDVGLWKASMGSYAFFYNNYFSLRQDSSKILGQDNFQLYVPKFTVVRIQQGDAPLDVLRVIGAALTCRSTIEISMDSCFLTECSTGFSLCNGDTIKTTREDENSFIQRIEQGEIKHLRLLSPPPQKMQRVLAEKGCNTVIAPVLANGRIELLQYLREVSLSVDYHRYGYLGIREETSQPTTMSKKCCDHCTCR